jgi:hypothetical protein
MGEGNQGFRSKGRLMQSLFIERAGNKERTERNP